MVAASVAGLKEIWPAPGGRVTSLAKVAKAQKGRDNIKLAARWLPTTGSYVSGMDSDRWLARDQLGPPKPSSSSRAVRLGATGPQQRTGLGRFVQEAAAKEMRSSR